MGAQEKSPVPSNSMQHAKFYRLNDDGKWDDQGTGHVSVNYFEQSEELALFVVAEENSETLLIHHICPDDIYRKKGTIISWRDPDLSTELSLSFQETAGCSYIWDHICNMQRILHISSHNGHIPGTSLVEGGRSNNLKQALLEMDVKFLRNQRYSRKHNKKSDETASVE